MSTLSDAYRCLLRCLSQPATMASLTPAQWSALFPMARRAQVVGRLAGLAKRDGVFEQIPEGPASHLEGALLAANKHHRDVQWEVRYIQQALADLPEKPLLLKGAGYVVGGEASGLGRIFGDFDVLVPSHLFAQAERALLVHGWQFEKNSAYDVAYYRNWMHQIPPLRHVRRGSVIDLHNALRPRVAPGHRQMDPLFAAARDVPGTGFRVPCPEDLVIHSAAHLFCNGEFDNALRDLSDLDLLIRTHCETPGWLQNVVERATLLGLRRPLGLAFIQLTTLLQTPIPRPLVIKAAGRQTWRPIDLFLSNAIVPPPAGDTPMKSASRWLMYVRGHFLTLPAHLLVWHAIRKSWYNVMTSGKKPLKDATN